MPINYIPQTKREKDKKQILLSQYPLKMYSSLDSHLKDLEVEMKKAKPREGVLLPLMKSTFLSRRSWKIDEH